MAIFQLNCSAPYHESICLDIHVNVCTKVNVNVCVNVCIDVHTDIHVCWFDLCFFPSLESVRGGAPTPNTTPLSFSSSVSVGYLKFVLISFPNNNY